MVFQSWGTWSYGFSRSIAPFFDKVYLLKTIRADSPCDPSVELIENEKLIATWYDVDSAVLDDILDEYDIDIAFQHWELSRRVLKIQGLIYTRNALLKKGKISGKAIDLFLSEGGFLRPSTEQLDIEGACGWNSIGHKIFPPLNDEQDQELDKWIKEWRDKKIGGRPMITREELKVQHTSACSTNSLPDAIDGGSRNVILFILVPCPR